MSLSWIGCCFTVWHIKCLEPRTISDGIGPNKILAARSRSASWGASFLFIYLNFFLNSRMSKYIAEFTKKKQVFPYMFMSDINTVTLWSWGISMLSLEWRLQSDWISAWLACEIMLLQQFSSYTNHYTSFHKRSFL